MRGHSLPLALHSPSRAFIRRWGPPDATGTSSSRPSASLATCLTWLQSISAIGNDFELSPGTCGKGHKEYVPVASGGPHLRMKARLG